MTAELLPADVTVQAHIEAVVAAAAGRVDVLANVAGVMDHFLPLSELDDDTGQYVMGTHHRGDAIDPEVLPLMKEAGSGSVVTVASEASLRGGSAGVAYTCSKHAVIGLVQHVAYF